MSSKTNGTRIRRSTCSATCYLLRNGPAAVQRGQVRGTGMGEFFYILLDVYNIHTRMLVYMQFLSLFKFFDLN